MSKIVIITGPSGSGKDSVTKALQRFLQFQKGVVATPIKFSRPMKSCLEMLYNLPESALDYPEGKALPVPDMDGLTFLELLISTWKDSQNTIFGNIWRTLTISKINKGLEGHNWVICNDVRSSYEVELLKLYSTPKVIIKLTGRGEVLDSDLGVTDLLKETGWPFYEVDNSGYLSDTFAKVKSFLF